MMDELNLRDYLPRIKAPSDFEENVLKKVAERKRRKKGFFFLSTRIPWQWSLATATTFLVAVVILGVFFIPRWIKPYEDPGTAVKLPLIYSRPVEPSILSLTEPVDFREEFGGFSESRVVYILEAVNENFVREVKY